MFRCLDIHPPSDLPDDQRLPLKKMRKTAECIRFQIACDRNRRAPRRAMVYLLRCTMRNYGRAVHSGGDSMYVSCSRLQTTTMQTARGRSSSSRKERREICSRSRVKEEEKTRNALCSRRTGCKSAIAPHCVSFFYFTRRLGEMAGGWLSGTLPLARSLSTWLSRVFPAI